MDVMWKKIGQGWFGHGADVMNAESANGYQLYFPISVLLAAVQM